MDISVIVVTYNQESSIGRTLDSILSQKTEAEFEIVIGDDCSTDGTEAVCRRYAVQYPGKIKYIRRDRNLGVVGNYFDCIEKSQGRYLADCAGDDYWVDDTKLQKQYEILERHSAVGLVVTDWMCRDVASGRLFRQSDVRHWPQVVFFKSGSLLKSIVTHEVNLHLCTALYRADIVVAEMRKAPHVFLDKEFSCEDLQIQLALAKNSEVAWLPDVTLHYSIGHDSISHKRDFAKRAKYSARTLRQSLILQKYFLAESTEDDKKEIEKYNERIRNYITALVFRAGPQIKKADIPAEMLTSGSVKGSIYKMAMSNDALWKMALALRNLIPE